MHRVTRAGSTSDRKPAILCANSHGDLVKQLHLLLRFMTDSPLLPTRSLSSPASIRSRTASPIPSFPHPTTSSSPNIRDCLACNDLHTKPIAYIRPIENTQSHILSARPRRADSLVLANWCRSPSRLP